MRRIKERKPAWLRTVFPTNGKSGLTVLPCPGCGKYIIEDRTGIWERYDINGISGTDLTVAIILDRPLCRLEWTHGAEQPHLIRVSGSHGLDPAGQYVAGHECGEQRISETPIRPPRKHRPPGKPWGGQKPTPQEIQEFNHIWNTPLNQLKGTQ